MSSGGLITDYLSVGTGAPSTPPDVVAGEWAFYQDDATDDIYAWGLDGAAWVLVTSGGGGGVVYNAINNGRLTLTTGVPVTPGDVTGATTVYFTPYLGNHISLYDGANWLDYSFTEISISLAGKTADTNYDVFIFDSSGLTLELVAWTNDTTRATAITLQNGIYCKNGTLTKRYLGTLRINGSGGQCEDTLSQRYLWNYQNRVNRAMKKVDTTDSWTYASASYRAANNSSANRLAFVCGLAENSVDARVLAHVIESNTQVGVVGIGLDSTTANSALVYGGASGPAGGIRLQIGAAYKGVPGIGFHYLQWLEYAVAGTVTFEGDNGVTYEQSGIIGEVWA